MSDYALDQQMKDQPEDYFAPKLDIEDRLVPTLNDTLTEDEDSADEAMDNRLQEGRDIYTGLR